MADKTPQHARTVAGEAKANEPRMAERALDRRRERPEREPVARGEFWRRRALFGAHAIIAGPEGDRHEARGTAKIDPRGKPDLDLFVARAMHAHEARRQRRRVIGDDKIARAQKRRQRGPRQMQKSAACLGDEKFCGLRVGPDGGGHGCEATASGARA